MVLAIGVIIAVMLLIGMAIMWLSEDVDVYVLALTHVLSCFLTLILLTKVA